MSYHVKGDVRFKDLPERILVREDGYMTAYVFEGEPIADYWYVPESECLKLRTENAKLRELMKAAYRCIRANVSCEECRLVCSGCTLQTAMRELGVDVDG